MSLIDVIISYGADLATTTRAGVDTANRSGRVTRVRWGQVSWEVWPGDDVERGVLRFHAAAKALRLQQAKEKDDDDAER